MTGILIIQHAPNCPPGNILTYVPQATTMRMWETPTALEALAQGKAPLPSVLIVLGGTQNAYAHDHWPWLRDVKTLLARCHDAHIPTLGICLGMQLAAVAAGGSVTVNAPEGPEIGLTQIYWNTTDPHLSALKNDEWVYADHHDAVTQLPPTVQVLARSDKYIHVTKWGSVIGVQYHPEVTPDIVKQWLTQDPPPHADNIQADYETAASDLNEHCQRLCHETLG